MKLRLIDLAKLALCLLASPVVNATDLKTNQIATEQFYGSTLSFNPLVEAENTTLSIAGPNGFYLQTNAKQSIPTIDLAQNDHLEDGIYNYEFTVAVGEQVLVKDTINNGRGKHDSHWARLGKTQTGHFRVVNGQIKQYKPLIESKQSFEY